MIELYFLWDGDSCLGICLFHFLLQNCAHTEEPLVPWALPLSVLTFHLSLKLPTDTAMPNAIGSLYFKFYVILVMFWSNFSRFDWFYIKIHKHL